MTRFLLWLALAAAWGLFLDYVVDLPIVAELLLALVGAG